MREVDRFVFNLIKYRNSYEKNQNSYKILSVNFFRNQWSNIPPNVTETNKINMRTKTELPQKKSPPGKTILGPSGTYRTTSSLKVKKLKSRHCSHFVAFLDLTPASMCGS